MSFTAEKVGYPDWQRMVNWDGPVLWSTPATSTPPNITSPIFETARYGYLGGTFQYNSGKGSITFTWFADAAGTITLGVRTFYVTAASSQIAQLRIPNLGPWCQVLIQPQGGGPVNMQAIIAATNRSHPLEVVPAVSEVIKVIGQAIGIGVTTTLTPLYMLSGPVHTWFDISATPMDLQLWTADSSGTQQLAWEETPTAIGDTHTNIIVPGGGYSFRIVNRTGVAQTFWLSITSSGTGST